MSFDIPFGASRQLWFDDGDIHVCARRFDTGALCFFKLYRDLIAAQSSVLLYLLDKYLAHRRIYIGDIAYAYLADDDALDLERFFIAVHYPIHFLLCNQDARTFTRALPLLQIALKYEAHEVVSELGEQLAQDWPGTLEEWDGAHSEGPWEVPFGEFCFEVLPSYRAAVVETASAIRVAQIASVPILGAAYYKLYMLSDDEAWRRNTMSQLGPINDGHRQKRFRGGHKCDTQVLLTKEDLRRMASGEANLSKHMRGFKKRVAKVLAPHPKCASAWKARVSVAQSKDVLADLLDMCSVKAFLGTDMCSECRSSVNERASLERGKVWKMLPKFFGVSNYFA